MAGGRPTDYNEEKAAEICERLASGESLRSICLDEDMPVRSTVFRWLSHHDEFSIQYTRAREEQADAIFDEILDIADDGRNDWMEKNGSDGESLGWQFNAEAARRSQIRIDARKWMAGKMRPKKYSDKLEVAHSGKVDGNMTVTVSLSDEELEKIAAGK